MKLHREDMLKSKAKRNSSVGLDEMANVIGKFQLLPEPAHDAMVVKLYRPYIQFPRNVRPISSAHRDCSAIRYRDFLSVF